MALGVLDTLLEVLEAATNGDNATTNQRAVIHTLHALDGLCRRRVGAKHPYAHELIVGGRLVPLIMKLLAVEHLETKTLCIALLAAVTMGTSQEASSLRDQVLELHLEKVCSIASELADEVLAEKSLWLIGNLVKSCGAKAVSPAVATLTASGLRGSNHLKAEAAYVFSRLTRELDLDQLTTTFTATVLRSLVDCLRCEQKDKDLYACQKYCTSALAIACFADAVKHQLKSILCEVVNHDQSDSLLAVLSWQADPVNVSDGDAKNVDLSQPPPPTRNLRAVSAQVLLHMLNPQELAKLQKENTRSALAGLRNEQELMDALKQVLSQQTRYK